MFYKINFCITNPPIALKIFTLATPPILYRLPYASICQHRRTFSCEQTFVATAAIYAYLTKAAKQMRHI